MFISDYDGGRSASERHKHFLVWVATAVTPGSGILNLLSVIAPSLRERILLREVFPLEFLAVSRFLTPLIGFALVICSLMMAKRRKRAFQLALLLAGSSALFHMTKGLDYEEAIFSPALLALLLFVRTTFTVESSGPDFREGVLRLGTALLIAIGYGLAGFWLLGKISEIKE